MSKYIVAQFNEIIDVTFNVDGYINATQVAKHFGREVKYWLRNEGTQEYIADLLADFKGEDYTLLENRGIEPGETIPQTYEELVVTKKGRYGGTWLHPKLAIVFARWISTKFAIWCDRQIEKMLHGGSFLHKPAKWRSMWEQTSLGYRWMSDVLKERREEQGKETKAYHYTNEARLVNYAISDHFAALDRNAMCEGTLRLLAGLQQENSGLIMAGVDYEERKKMLVRTAERYRQKHNLPPANEILLLLA